MLKASARDLYRLIFSYPAIWENKSVQIRVVIMSASEDLQMIPP